MKNNLLVCRSGGEFASSSASLLIEKAGITSSEVEDFWRNQEFDTLEFARHSNCEFTHGFSEIELVKMGKIKECQND